MHNHKETISAILVGIVFLVISIFISYLASSYADTKPGQPINDILLDNLQVMDVDGILNYGALAFILFICWFAFQKHRLIPFILKSLALFIFIRAIFISLTHLGAPEAQLQLDSNDLMSRLLLGRDLFFSGHTGMPFLMALVFWKDKMIRAVSITVSLIFAASVLLGHFHYSIDVFAAFFIADGIFRLAQRIFPRDWQMFDAALAQ